jgi:YbgC/YbaW family acyl-CoA thioester hydrolase
VKKTQTTLRVRYAETDQMGIVHHANYAQYFEEGDVKASELEDYNSHNTHRLTLDETKTLLLTLDLIKDEIAAWKQR